MTVGMVAIIKMALARFVVPPSPAKTNLVQICAADEDGKMGMPAARATMAVMVGTAASPLSRIPFANHSLKQQTIGTLS
jgi:hypothetical protein